jgi:hypothetical protein
MARIHPNSTDQLPNPSKVWRAEPQLNNFLLGNWNAASPRQSWTSFVVSPDQRVKITAGSKVMSGLIESHASGKLLLTLYAGAGESTVQLEGMWQIHGQELRLEFKATDMIFNQSKP